MKIFANHNLIKDIYTKYINNSKNNLRKQMTHLQTEKRLEKNIILKKTNECL